MIDAAATLALCAVVGAGVGTVSFLVGKEVGFCEGMDFARGKVRDEPVIDPTTHRHRKPVTVESVLREFAEESLDIDMCGELDVLVAEYASRLRLAEEDE